MCKMKSCVAMRYDFMHCFMYNCSYIYRCNVMLVMHGFMICSEITMD